MREFVTPEADDFETGRIPDTEFSCDLVSYSHVDPLYSSTVVGQGKLRSKQSKLSTRGGVVVASSSCSVRQEQLQCPFSRGGVETGIRRPGILGYHPPVPKPIVSDGGETLPHVTYSLTHTPFHWAHTASHARRFVQHITAVVQCR